MVKVELANDVFEAIKQRAEPLVDDVNSVLRREFKLAKAAPRSRAQPGSLLAIAVYEPAARTALRELGAISPARAAHRRAVIDRVGQLLEDKFGEHDYSLNSSGRVRWQHRASWVLTRLKQAGVADNDGRGNWWLVGDGNGVTR